MTTQRISAINLLRDTLALVGSIYPALFRINSPHLIYFVVNTFGGDAMLNIYGMTQHQIAAASVFGGIFYWSLAVPFLFGATTFYTYRIFRGNQVTVIDAFIQAKRRLLPLLLVYFLSVVLIVTGITWCLRAFPFVGLIIIQIILIPGLYVSYRLMFLLYAIVINNNSVVESFKSSWQLTKRRWWLVFRSMLLISLVFLVPLRWISELIGLRWQNWLGTQLVGNVLGFIAGLLMNVYLVLLYQRLRESAAATQ
ncbi:glycerophosphoryl diester phosphodiesterase membrane domain-containing protein [Microcoleus sp.]|uniref:glycerophosphoryl diester phosphodiesterase membrane domain-containing protein n=1 Tax=Microcoleus sp. TaxID=44472 RepID=UPI00359350E8